MQGTWSREEFLVGMSGPRSTIYRHERSSIQFSSVWSRVDSIQPTEADRCYRKQSHKADMYVYVQI